jgi:hypothetical protein
MIILIFNKNSVIKYTSKEIKEAINSNEEEINDN